MQVSGCLSVALVFPSVSTGVGDPIRFPHFQKSCACCVECVLYEVKGGQELGCNELTPDIHPDLPRAALTH